MTEEIPKEKKRVYPPRLNIFFQLIQRRAFSSETLIAPIVRAYVRRNLNYGVSERENVCVGGARWNGKRRERKEAQRDAKRRLVIYRLRPVSKTSKQGFPLVCAPYPAGAGEKTKRKRKEDSWAIFIIPRHYSSDARAR